MQRTAIILAYFFIPTITGTNSFAQSAASGGQYPFVHYTPKDGLISNQIRNIYQDSRGRLYFTSINGLSVYDGSRFSNYTSANGLDNDIVNCVMEMGDDSIWIVTNRGKIQCLVNGKLKSIEFNNTPPLIDNLIHDEKGSLYAASEQGLFIFRDNKFVKLSFLEIKQRNNNEYVGNICPAGNYLLIVRDNSMLDTREKNILYLYDPLSEKIIAQTEKETIHDIAKAPDGRIWASTNEKVLAIDTIDLKKGTISFNELPAPFDKTVTTGLPFLNFDQYGNCWMTDKVFILKKISPDGNEISFTTGSGLRSMDISHAFIDKEGITWITSFSEGVYKLVNSNFSFFGNLSGISAINSLSYSADSDQIALYSPHNSKAVTINKNNTQIFDVINAIKFPKLIITPNGFFGYSDNEIYELTISGRQFYPKTIFADSVNSQFDNPLVDKNGNTVFCGKEYLTVLINKKTVYRKKINYFVDHAALDQDGNIWIANRAHELIMYRPDPGDPSNYLANEIMVSKIPDISPRSIVIDKNNNIWIGSRHDGICIYKMENSHLVKLFSLTTATGLSDNFISQLACDNNNNVWAGSPSGLDKISLRDGVPVIENLTKQNSIYQKVYKVIIDKKNIVWAHTTNGIIKITQENNLPANYSPTLIISMIKAGKDTIAAMEGSFLSHKQNNLNFYFGATSFIDEKQVLYQYRLRGAGTNQWSEPSNNATVSLIDLPPGDYILDVKANFPAGRYPEKIINYKFSIAPPWWQTWWFRSIAGLLIIGLLIIGTRFYYRRKLEKQKMILEKQQAIEKERTRIATDMHDDLGAGLSRIKFLSQALSNRQGTEESIKTGLVKITAYSDEMTEKMGEIVWALNEKNDTLADLVAYTRSYALEYLGNHNIHCNASTPTQLPGTFIAGEIRRNIFLAVKESLHNIIKHAEATTVNFSIELNGTIEIVIHDNGKGIKWNEQRKFSNGLMNIKKRLEEIKGKAEFINEQGTKVVLQAPLDL